MTEQITHGTMETAPPEPDGFFLTIAVPTLNRLAYLRETLESVFCQTCADFEIIVSNNCSCDGTKEYLDRLDFPRLEIFHQESTMAMIDNWNYLLQRANGLFFLLLSDDDLIAPDFVERCKETYGQYHDKGDQISVMYGSTGIIDTQGVVQEHWRNDDFAELEPGDELVINWFKGQRPVSFCSTLFRTTSIKILGGFDHTNRYAADVVARSRLAVNNYVLYVREALAYYRVHEQNATYQSFSAADRLGYNLDIAQQALKAVVDNRKRVEIERAGEKYAKLVFISESAVASITEKTFSGTVGFIATYLRNFSIVELMFFDLVHFFRRMLTEARMRRSMPGTDSSGRR